ncbi:hypothetical protein [Microbacterium sp.]|uniref:hypothetical protein n=1 Tax=Microbacterium sp. TaxID=51671 RepID=UPI0028A64ED2|nr:hypothetical protein [Microbacterium sp.]
MFTIAPPGTPSADEMAALLDGARLLDDALDILAQVRAELDRLIDDSHWEAAAVRMLRAALIGRAGRLVVACADIASYRDECLAALV